MNTRIPKEPEPGSQRSSSSASFSQPVDVNAPESVLFRTLPTDSFVLAKAAERPASSHMECFWHVYITFHYFLLV